MKIINKSLMAVNYKLIYVQNNIHNLVRVIKLKGL